MQTMEALGRLAGGVAHDFNNLLQAMLSYITVLRSAAGNPQRTAAIADEMVQQVDRGVALARQLLQLSQLNVTRPEPVELNAAISAASVILRHLLRANVTLTVEPAAASLHVLVDPGQLDQVLINLAANSADAMPEGGVLTISAIEAAPGLAGLAVADAGHGIPGDVRQRIFEPFFSTKEGHKGAGLGLSVVQGIVTRHGGRIEVESELGAGTTVRVLFPATSPPALPPVAAPVVQGPAQPPRRGARVLLVEDEDAAREGLRQVLSGLGFTVVAAASGGEAGRLPLRPAFDLLLTDVVLPDVSGTDLAASLRERWPGLKVVLMSGYTEDEALRGGATQRKVRFLQKPFDMTILARELHAALDEV